VDFEKFPTTQVVWREKDYGFELNGPIFANHYSKNGILSVRRFIRIGDPWDMSVFHVKHLLRDANDASDLIPDSDIHTISTVHHFTSRSITKTVHKLGIRPDLQVHYDGLSFLMKSVRNEVDALSLAVKMSGRS
jgi:hypothetical protein